jgi:uncharacterized protein (UPF0335 family)
MDVGGIAGDRLGSFVERYERLQGEIDDLNKDKAELIKEVEGTGFDKKVFKIVIKRRRMSPGQRGEEDALVALYERALASPDEETSEAEVSRADARVHAHEGEPAAAAV